jgi:DNA-binding response OmpR family regulator
MHLLYVTDRQVDAYLVKALREAGHVVEATALPADGVIIAAGGDHQVIVLDCHASTADWTARFAEAAVDALVMVISTGDDSGERASVLRAGADACFVRPASVIELQARLEALTRLVQRSGPKSPAAPVEMLAAERAVRLNGRSIPLAEREFRLMAHLVAHPGEVTGLDRLEQQVWGDGLEPRPDRVRSCVSRLRRKLEAAGAAGVVRAVAGHGYRFDPTGGCAEPAANPKMKISSPDR